jgi:hypothetical protein
LALEHVVGTILDSYKPQLILVYVRGRRDRWEEGGRQEGKEGRGGGKRGKGEGCRIRRGRREWRF